MKSEDKKGFEAASAQIRRERAARKMKRNKRQRKKIQLLARRRGIQIESERRITDELVKSAGILKRIRWWFITAWRKLLLTG